MEKSHFITVLPCFESTQQLWELKSTLPVPPQPQKLLKVLLGDCSSLAEGSSRVLLPSPLCQALMDLGQPQVCSSQTWNNNSEQEFHQTPVFHRKEPHVPARDGDIGLLPLPESSIPRICVASSQSRLSYPPPASPAIPHSILTHPGCQPWPFSSGLTQPFQPQVFVNDDPMISQLKWIPVITENLGHRDGQNMTSI